MDEQFHPTLYQAGDYLSMLRLKLNHVSKMGPWCLADTDMVRTDLAFTAIWLECHVWKYPCDIDV